MVDFNTNLAESSEEGSGPKRVVFSVMMMILNYAPYLW
jgi:hypothetical protein